jgi:hypothetical protein
LQIVKHDEGLAFDRGRANRVGITETKKIWRQSLTRKCIAETCPELIG